MGYKKSCVWYDETKNADCHLCYRLLHKDSRIFIGECPKNCGNYINRNSRDEELRRLIFEKI